MEKFTSKGQEDKNKILDLNFDLVLNNEDVESVIEELPEEMGSKTLLWKAKEGFPTYHLDPAKRLLVVLGNYGDKIKVFKLKESSQLLKKYSEKYRNR